MSQSIVAGRATVRKCFMLVALAVCAAMSAQSASACVTDYAVARHDTLAQIAKRFYRHEDKWVVIFYANQQVIELGGGPRVGQVLKLPCSGQDGASPPAVRADAEAPPAEPAVTTTSSVTNLFKVDPTKVRSLIVQFHKTRADGVGEAIGFASVEEIEIKIADRKETALAVRFDLKGLTPGPHALHVHAKPECGAAEHDGKSVPGLAAGPHLFAYGTGATEGVKFTSHLGDLPDLKVADDGTTTDQVVAPRLRLSDVRKRAIIIHDTADDASGRQACAVIP